MEKTKEDVLILAIESSCDETAASVVKNGRTVLSNIISSQIELHKLYGGVVPEIASRKHIEKINQVIEEALKEADVTLDDLDAIGVTYGPGLVGALLVGMLCDSVGRKKLILISRVMVLLCSWPSFWLLVNYPSPGMLLTVVFVMVSFTTLGGVPVMLLISELLPKRIRALGFALVYSIGVAIFGGFAQYFATQSIVLLDSLTAPAWYLGGGTLLSMLALLYVKEPAKELQ